ncbi:hypothetical protein T08_5737 [Trichinella sp. T8]|nr:hypothetical protein T08_5737 [Trichinella sp. T8]
MTELNKDDNNDNPTIRQHHLCVRYQRGETAQLRTWNKIEHRLSASTSGVTHILTTCSSTWDDKCGQSFFENYFCRCCEPTTRMSSALSTIISFCRFIHSTKFHHISSTLNLSLVIIAALCAAECSEIIQKDVEKLENRIYEFVLTELK